MEMETVSQTSASTKGITPSKVYSTTNCEEAVQLRVDANETFEPISVPGLLNQTVQKYGDNIALVTRTDADGNFRTIAYNEYQQKIFHVAKAFIKLGLEVRHSVGILGFNCPEWFYSELAAIHAGGIAAGIYTTNSAEVVCHILENSKANIVIVDDSKQMTKVRQIRHRLPFLKAAIQLSGPFEEYVEENEGYFKWSDIESMDVTDAETELENRLESIKINECCSLIYTSGTTGMPKGVMLSHDNITFVAQTDLESLSNLITGKERIVSYLPLSHIAAQVTDVFLAILMAATVYFADKDALKGTLTKTLQRARPTFFGGVPRVFEKIEEKISSTEAQLNVIIRTLMSWARNAILQYHMNVSDGKKGGSLQYKIARNTYAKKLKYALGLDQSRTIYCGGAPLSLEHKKFFLSLDLPITEVYGLSECSGAHCVGPINSTNFDAVGKTVKDTQVKIMNPDNKGEGELCLKGRNIFMGYLGSEEKTKEALDDDGWLHTGDIGRIDDAGYVYITGRLKEILITAGGENIPPAHIESLVKNELPFLSNAFLVGDRKKYLTMLVTLKTDMDSETGEPLDTLQYPVIKYLKEELHLNYSTLKEILDAGPCPKVLECIQKGIDRANLQAISNAQKVQKFVILPHDFSIATGELGPTLKVKRNVVCKMYEVVINNLCT